MYTNTYEKIIFSEKNSRAWNWTQRVWEKHCQGRVAKVWCYEIKISFRNWHVCHKFYSWYKSYSKRSFMWWHKHWYIFKVLVYIYLISKSYLIIYFNFTLEQIFLYWYNFQNLPLVLHVLITHTMSKFVMIAVNLFLESQKHINILANSCHRQMMLEKKSL